MANPGDQDYNRALDAVEKGDLPTAIDAVESALMHDPQDGDFWQLYAVLLAQAGRAEDATRATAKAKTLGLNDADALLMKAAEAAITQDWNKAVTACEQALEIAPNRPEIWASYAANLIEGGYKKDALEASAKAVELLPEEAQVQYLRGRILRLNQQGEDSITAYHKAIELDDSLALAWYEKGMVHHQQNDLAMAKECFLKAKSLNLDDPGIEEALRIITSAQQG